MTEEFLHYIWKYRLLGSGELRTTAGEPLAILKPGQHNTHAGPDFFNAKIKIAGTTWAGNVEIHVSASDWNKHKHCDDGAYDNVILHVVFHNDKQVLDNKGEPLPTLDLSPFIDLSIYERYAGFMKSRAWVPCQGQIRAVDEFTVSNWLDRLVASRLERKTADILRILELTNNDWAETFYIWLARNFGFKVNALPFELLARSLPLSYLAKHRDNRLQVEAMLLGQAGLLGREFNEDYPLQLKKEYRFFAKKFNLQPLDGHLWKYLRLRPSNFPTIRISQFACLIHRSTSLFSKVLEAKHISELTELFDATASEYWETHYTFDKPSAKKTKHLGRNSLHVILINTVVPFIFLYGKQKQLSKYQDKALELLREIDGDKNAIINRWKELGLPVSAAYHTQALLELKNEYCNQKKCLSCGIGNRILSR